MGTRRTQVTLVLGAARFITIRVGATVLVRDASHDCYGAVVSSLTKTTARLTFTPPGVSREVPLGLILSAVTGARLVDPKAIPRYQPPPTQIPRRRQGIAAS